MAWERCEIVCTRRPMSWSKDDRVRDEHLESEISIWMRQSKLLRRNIVPLTRKLLQPAGCITETNYLQTKAGLLLECGRKSIAE